MVNMEQFRQIPKWVLLLTGFLTITPFMISDISEYYIDDLSWFILLFPCFIFSYYLGLKGGVYTAILVNMIHISWYISAKYLDMAEIVNQELSLHIGIAIITFLCSISVGYLSEKLKEKQVELQKLNSKLAKIANHDALTGLPNRIYFREKLQNSLNHQALVSILFIDLDGFKSVNDTYGHDEGDRVLKKVADKLNQFVNDFTFVSRLGGDEFIVLFDNKDKNYVNDKAAEILKELQIKINDLTISASIGIATHQSGDDPSALLKTADTAMYQAKTNGKNKICILSS